MPKHLFVTLSVLVGLATAGIAAPAVAGAAEAFPDLKTQAPRDLRFAQVDFDEVVTDSPGSGVHTVLQFSNSVYNAGESPLVVRGDIDTATRRGPAYQRVYDTDGNFVRERPAGDFYWHESHKHYHYEQWGIFQLWTKADYDEWLETGEEGPEVQTGFKTTSCILDEEFWATLPGTRADPLYNLNGCYPPNGQDLMEGLSVGWSDTYDWYRPDQWIDLGSQHLADGEYVLRSVSDPDNQIQESASGTVAGDPDRESRSSNAAIRRFKVQGGQIVDSDKPTGTVTLNKVDRTTDSPAVTLRAIGRDDVSGPNRIRISNNGVTWSERSFTDWGSTPNEIPWNLSDTTTGGNASYGVKTIYVQFRDGSGKWGDTVTDQIELVPSGTNTAYTNTVRADGAATHLRFDDASGASRPREEIARNDGWYIGTPVKAQPTLLGSAGEQYALRFDSNNDHVYVPSPSGLNAASAMSLEAWVKADTLPLGTQRTILAKPGRYALRTNGTNLEFSITTPSGTQVLTGTNATLQAGLAYHVVATYDGSSMKLYVNGVPKDTRTATGQIAAGGGDLYIGAPDDGTAGRWLGTIDEPAVYPLALTPAKAQSHYDTGRVPLQRPAVPTNVTATPESSSRIRLRWTDNADNENAHVIERKLSTQDWADAESLATSQDEVSYLDLGLSPNTAYDYRIRARNSAGLSDWSTVASATTRQAPTAVTDTADPVAQTTATLKGRVNPRGTSTSYWFEYGTSTSYGSRAPATDASAGSGTTETARSQAISGLSAGTTYHYRVVAKSDETVVRGSDVTFTTLPNAPSAPTGLNATATSGTAINLSWTDVSGETSYVLERSTDSTFATGVTSTTPAQNATSASATGLANDTTYYFRLKARNSGGDSAWSSTGSARTHGAPVVTASHDSVTRTTATLKGTVDPRGAIASYRFDYGTSTQYGSSTTLKSASSAGAVSEPITGLQPNTTYFYRLFATNSIGGREATGSFTTPADPAPGTPTGLNATATSGTAINATWNDVSGETSYELQRSTSSTFTSPTTTTVAANATSASVTGLANDTTYYFRIRARNSNGGGDSAFSSTASARTHGVPVVSASHDDVTRNTATLNGTVDPRGATTTYRFDYGTSTAYGASTTSKTGSGAVSEPISGLQPNTTYHYRLVANNSVGTTQATGSFTTDPEPPPATPSGLSATAASGTQINVSWSDVSGETAYVLERSTSSTFASGVTSEATPAGDTSESITGLANDTTYYFRVKARNAGGDSGWSTTASARTHGAPVVTAAHENVTRTTATLKGTVDPRGATTSYRFDYGTSTSYGSSTTQKNASSAGGVSEPISGLAPNTTYYYKLVATNTIGTREATGSFTTSPDPTPSTPTGLTATAVSGTAIAVTWNDANGETSYQLQRSTSSDFSTDLTTTAPAAGDTSAAATGLANNTTYFFRIRARNSNGGGDSAWSSIDSATTHGAPAVTAAHDGVTRTEATLTGTVDPRGAATTYRFEYKADSDADWTSTTSKSAGSGRGATPVSEALAGLQPNTPYEYKLVANNAIGTHEAAGTFTTPAEPPPIAVTGDASDVGTTAVTLSGAADPEGFGALYRFEYGPSDTYGNVTSWTDAGSGADPTTWSETLAGLTPATEYHYRFVVAGPGGTVYGDDRTFTTASLPVPRPPGRPQQPPRDDEDPKPPVDQPDPPNQPDTDPPTTQTRVPAQTIARVLKRGLRLRFRADEDGRLTTRVYVSGRTLGLRGSKARRRVTVGRLTKDVVAGRTYTISVKLSKRARNAVKRRRSVRFTIESVMTDEAGNKTRKLRSSAVVHSRR